MKKIVSTTIYTLFFLLFIHSKIDAWIPVDSPRESISQERWEQIVPFLVPEDSELKEKLDAIFEDNRPTLSENSMEKAGFTSGKPREFSRVVVTKHSSLPGYVFKIYLDKDKYKPDERAQFFLIKRVYAAEAIRNKIEENNLQAYLKVPKKWIYLLPESKKPSKKYSYKSFILVEEDMNILDKKANKRAWKSSKVTEQALVGLYDIVRDIGLADCIKIDNIPFSEDGKIAFIDTEAYGYEDVKFKRLKKSLPHKLRSFWRKLID